MTTDTQGRPSRRSFLSIATAVTLAATSGLVLNGAPSASAATGADVTWHLSSEPSEAKTGYVSTINSIREAIRAGTVRSEETAPRVDVTDREGTSSYITVDLHAEDRNEFIRVWMRRSDAYVMGFRPGTDNGQGTVQWSQWIFPLESGVQLPGATGAQTNTRFATLAGYDALARQGANRDGMQISPSSLDNAVLTLTNAQNVLDVPVGDGARAILQLIVALAEGSRFRDQAAATATAFRNGVPFALSSQHMAQQNSWSNLSEAFLVAVVAGVVILSAPVEVGALVFGTTLAVARILMMAHHSDKDTKGRHLTEVTDKSLYVQPDEFGDYPTVQAAINAAPTDGVQRLLYLAPGTYREFISVSTSKRNLFIKGTTGNAADVVITGERAHGMIDPATGAKYGTQGSAVATFRAPGITVANVTIQNSFDPAKHPEINPFETQAVAVAAMGDRQTFTQCRILGRQDTVLAKGETPTTQARQYFIGCYIEGSIDFIFGNATAVVDRCNIALHNWVGGTILAPNTDKSKKYGILITRSTIFTNGVPSSTMYLGRPWHNTVDTWPQAVVRETSIASGITATHPWTDMTPDYSWTQARFKEYKNTGAGAGTGANAPQMTDSEAADYTAQKYLAGTDGWNPVW